MNSTATCTERSPSKGNPLAMLQGVGGKIAHSLKRTVTNNAATMFAGLSMLTAASSGTALATEVVLRDTIHNTPATTQDGQWLRCNQVPNPVPADMQGVDPIASSACLAVTIPANSVCTLKSLEYVYGVRATAPKLSTSDNNYDWRKLFNTYNDLRTTDVRLQVIDGPSTNLVSRQRGDLYDRSLSEQDLATSMPWGDTSVGIISGVRVPYNKGEVAFTGIGDIVTGDSTKTIYIKMTTEALQRNLTWMVWANTVSDPSEGDISLNFDSVLNQTSTALAAKVIADIRPKETNQSVPACGMERIDGKMAVCWPASYGTNYNVGSSTNFTQWGPQEIEGIVTANGKNYAVLKTNGAGSCFFRLESK